MDTAKTLSAASCDSNERATWIGYGDLWPRSSIVNTITWTPKQNTEYQAAYDVQKIAIQRALAAETPEAESRRTGWVGGRCPDPSNKVFDKCWALKEVEKSMEFKKGLICGLEHGRDRNENMLAAAKLELVKLSEWHVALLEKFYAHDSEHLNRKKLCVFTRDDDAGSDVEILDVDTSASVLGKRSVGEGHAAGGASKRARVAVPGETSEYWLQSNRLTKGLKILSWDKHHDDGDVHV